MRSLIFILFALLLSVQTALACTGPALEDHHYPSCVIPLPEGGMRVTVLGYNYFQVLSSVHVGYERSRTRLMRVNVAPNDDRHYLLLSAHDQTIWHFTGATETIKQVVVLGAARHGPDAAGVIGIPEDRIVFTSPDLSLLDAAPRTSCSRIYKACTPEQWRGEDSDPRITFYPDRAQTRLPIDAILPMLAPWKRAENNPFTLVDPESRDALIQVDPAAVISPNPAQPYVTLTGKPGLDALVESGALVPKGAPLHTELTQAYGAAFSARFRSRFDPDFLFVPDVDYIVTRPITLPPELPRTRFLLASGVLLPDLDGNRPWRTCIFAMDRASQPMPDADLKGVFCRENIIGAAKADRDILNAAWLADDAARAPTCQTHELPHDVHIAAVLLSEGKHRRKRDADHRTIDINITRKGPVALYLSMEGGPVHWNITAPNVTAVFDPVPPVFNHNIITVNGAPFGAHGFREDTEECDWRPPQRPSRLGPGFVHLDERMKALTGYALNQIVVDTALGPVLSLPDHAPETYTIE